MKTKEEDSPLETRSRRKSSKSDQGPSTRQVTKQDDLKQKSDATKNLLKFKGQTDNLDRELIKYEEEQSIKRESSADLLEFRETCGNIEQLVTEMNDMKAQGVTGENSELLDKRLDAMILTTNLKRLNRYAQIRGKKAYESTLKEKNKVDELHLDLQNLLYEMVHMKKEIQKCMNFSSKDEEIDLVDIDTFYREAPEDISKPDRSKSDPHCQMLARLAWELRKRKELVQSKEELRIQKKKQEVDIIKKADYLNSLKPRLEEIIKATKPVQEFMNLPLEAERKLFDSAQYLPRPLYVLYIQAKAFKDVCNKNMNVTIEGDIAEAKADFHADDGDSDFESDSETENDENNDAGDGDGDRKRNKKEKDKTRLEDHRKRILKKHPLSVTISLTKKDKFIIVLNFNYLMNLRIATVDVNLTIKDTTVNETSSDLLASNIILKDLLSLDNGVNSPNSANKYQLEKLGMNPFSFYIHQVGQPYFWVQWICGLNYLPNQNITSYTPDSSISANHFQSVIKSIKSRITARLVLQNQLQNLENLSIPAVEDSSDLFPCKVVCLLTSWREISIDELQNSTRYEELDDFNLINEDCMLYEAKLSREEELKVIIIIHTDYPKHPPLMLLETPNNSAVKKINTETDLRCIECELNVYTNELLIQSPENMILSLMLRKLQICFDMYVETSSNSDTKEKLYTRQNRGRDRNRPYKYHKDRYFVHR